MSVHVAATVPAHAGGGSGTPLVVAVGLAGLGSVVLLGLVLAAYVRRPSLSYLLLALAIATLVVRASVAGLTMGGLLADSAHHVAEHGLDVATVTLVLGAVYYARRIERSSGGTAAADGGEPAGRRDVGASGDAEVDADS